MFSPSGYFDIHSFFINLSYAIFDSLNSENKNEKATSLKLNPGFKQNMVLWRVFPFTYTRSSLGHELEYTSSDHTLLCMKLKVARYE